MAIIHLLLFQGHPIRISHWVTAPQAAFHEYADEWGFRKAYKGTMCSYDYSGGVIVDHSEGPAYVARTVAHEVRKFGRFLKYQF